MSLRSLTLWLCLVAASGCARSVPVLFADAERRATAGDVARALDDYERAAKHRRATADQRVRALVAAGLLHQRGGNTLAARLRFERAASLAVVGQSEVACFYLAEILRSEDRARALNLYYQAAAGAEQHLSSRFPYRESMARIAELGAN